MYLLIMFLESIDLLLFISGIYFNFKFVLIKRDTHSKPSRIHESYMRTLNKFLGQDCKFLKFI